MKKLSSFSVLLATAIISLSSLSAKADTTLGNGYAVVEGGLSKLRYKNLNDKNKYFNSSVWGLGIGTKVNENFRSDVIVNYRPDYKIKEAGKMDGDNLSMSTKLSSISGMVNVYYDIANVNGLTPYVGAGVGVSRNKLGKVTITDSSASRTVTIHGKSKTDLAWQLSAGALFKVAENVAFNVGYRYIDMGKVSSKMTAVANGQVFNDAAFKMKGRAKAHEILGKFQFSF